MGSLKEPSAQETSIKSLIDSLKSSLSEYDSKGSYDRVKLKTTAEKLSSALENPGETAHRIAHYVGLSSKSMDESYVARCPA